MGWKVGSFLNMDIKTGKKSLWFLDGETSRVFVVRVEVRKMDDERQYVFFRIAVAMGEMYELEKMREALTQMEPGQLKKMVDDAIERGDSRVMITDKAYIDFQSSRGKANGI